MHTKNILSFIAAAILVVFGGFMRETQAKEYKAGQNRVEFKSEGEKMIGTLFLPANYKAGDKLPVIVVDGPWTQVKEQVGYRYAEKLAENGFAALAFDHRFWGESGGEPRFFESPSAKVADLKNAVNFLKTVSAVDANRIGGVGVCFGASYMMMTAAEDADLKSVAAVTAWLHDPASIKKLYGDERYDRYLQDGQKALADYRQNKAKVDYVLAASQTDNHAAMFVPDISANSLDYYFNERRGVIPEWTNKFAQMAWVDWLNLDSINNIAPKLTQPFLMIHSDNSALPDNARKFYSLVKSPKDLYWTTGNHLDFYDRDKEVNDAAQALVRHFQKTLNGSAAANSWSSAATERAANRRIVEDFFARLEAMDISGFVNLFDEAGVQEMPYAPVTFPKKLQGRAAIEKQYGGLPQNYNSMKFTNRVWHETVDPNKILVEFHGIIDVKSGKPYNNDYIGVFELKGGKITRYVEYFNPLILQESFGKDLNKNFNADQR